MGLTECRTIPLAPARPARPGGNIEVWCDGVRVARVRPRKGGGCLLCAHPGLPVRFWLSFHPCFVSLSFRFPCGPLSRVRSLLTPVVLSLPARPPPRRCPRLPRAARAAAVAASPVSSPHPSSHTCPASVCHTRRVCSQLFTITISTICVCKEICVWGSQKYNSSNTNSVQV